MGVVSVGSPVMWIGFFVFIVIMLAIDLGVFHRDSHELKFKEAMSWTIVWASLAGLFSLLVYEMFGAAHALEFVTGYMIEWALSIDNIFIFIVIFSYFSVPKHLQHRVLFWGIIGAVVMRGIFVFAGAALLARFHWLIYVFGAMLIFTSVRLFVQEETDIHPEKNAVVRFFKKFVPVVAQFHGSHFLIKEGGRWVATPLMVVLLVVETTDVIFALDSIPAIFAITKDPFIILTSNIFAILGLRSLYFLLSGVMNKFHYLRIGLALVLAFVGTKMLLSHYYNVPIVLSLSIVATLIGGSIIASLVLPNPHEKK